MEIKKKSKAKQHPVSSSMFPDPERIKTETAENEEGSAKTKSKKRKRLIVRNLSFKVGENELRKAFSKFGKVIDVNIPLKNDGKKRGFGFVEFDNTKSLIEAMKAMNYQEIKGRKVAIDFAVSKDRYTNENKTEIKEDSSDEEEETKIDSESESSDQDELPTKQSKNQQPTKPNQTPKKQSHDVTEGRTIFIRNVSFATNQESLSEAMREYGDTEYCLICTDKMTEQPKGTAFVKFRKKSCAEKLMEAAEQDSGVVLDGRKLVCSLAISRDKAVDLQLKDDKKKGKDNRNLSLLKVGVVGADSPESEGVSKGDMAKRMQLEVVRKHKLRNVNFFVSKTRLAVHNLPKTMSDAELRKMLKNAAGAGAIVTEARVMKEFKRTDAKGNPLSKGFGFVSFSQHENAMNALQELNNHPSVFHPTKRPIVEFSIENKVALLSQEKRKEKAQLRNKAVKKQKARKERMASLKSLKDKKNMYKEKLSKS